MKKALLFSSFIALAMLLGTSIFLQNGDKNYYQPREGDAKPGISGAMEWLNTLRADPATGEVSFEDVMKARQAVQEADAKATKKSSLNLNWEVVGPNNIGGRTRAFLIDNNDPNVMYAGSVSGGLFKSTNRGNTWSPVSNPASNLGVVSIAQTSDGTIYYGTGEHLYNRASGRGSAESPGFVGGGIYKSTDGGETFDVLTSTVPNNVSAGADWASVGKLAVDPNTDRLYAATNSGLRFSDDGGETWTNPFTNTTFRDDEAQDVVVTISGGVWVKIGSTIQYSPSGETGTFVQKTGGTIPTRNERMRIAVSPQDTNYVYVVSILDNRFDKAYQSTDGGNTWRVIGQRTPLFNPHGTQGNYNNALAVSPHNKERIIVGGIDNYEWSETGGWQRISLWNARKESPYYVHADNHDVVFSPTDANTFYIVNDGGIFRTTDDGNSFTALNANYVTMQFYNIGLGLNGSVIGGSQDNGTVLIDPNSRANQVVPQLGNSVGGGDGGYSQLSKLHPGVQFAEIYYGQAWRSSDDGETRNQYFDLDRMDPTGVYGTNQFAGWIMPYVLWEKLNDPHSTDSIRLGADTLVVNLGFGAGRTRFIGTFMKPFDTTIIVTESATITAGNRVLQSDADGVFRNANGDSVGVLNPATGSFEIGFEQSINQNVTARVATRYNAGSYFEMPSAINELPIAYTLPTDLEPGESVMIQDPVQAIMFVGPRSIHRSGRNNGGGIWMTREILSEMAGIPEWWHIGDLTNDETPISMAASDDGDLLFVGTSRGRVYRFSNLINARDSASADIDHHYNASGTLLDSSSSIVQKDVILDGLGANRVITSIASHPLDKSKLLVTAGNYNNSNYVFYFDDADGPDPTEQEVQGDLPQVPAYSCTFNYTAPDNEVQALVGTEFGVYSTADITAGNNVEWIHEVNNFSSVPVFSLAQERTVRYDLKLPVQGLEGAIFAGTYGRGIHKTMTTARISVEEEDLDEEIAVTRSLSIYPNPAEDIVNIEVSLESTTDIEVHVRDMNGKTVKTVKYNKLPRETESIQLRVNSLPKGAYVMSMQQDGRSTTGKFIKN